MVMLGFDLDDELEFQDIDLLSEETYRGEGDEAAAEPLRGRVRVGGPRGFEIPESMVAEDERLRRIIKRGDRRAVYYRVYLGIDFITHDGPRLEAAQVKLTLTADPAPVTLDVQPSAEGTAEKIERTVKVAPKLPTPVGDAEVGEFGAKVEYETTTLFVKGLGLEGSTPGWEFTRVRGRRLEGSCRLELIVQARRGAPVTVAGSVRAQAMMGRLLWRYRGELPGKLELKEYKLGG
jgi:hypothetical protein